MAEILLTRGLKTIIDDEDFNRISKYKWRACVFRGIPYAYRSQWKPKKELSMARQILNLPQSRKPYVDHANGNSLDNRKINLRICTMSQNQANRIKKVKATSKFKGVFMDSKYGKWASRITINGRHIFLGYHKTEKDAAHAYDVAAIKFFGEFARLNFPHTRKVMRLKKDIERL